MKANHNKKSGFTLIELLGVILLIALLLAITMTAASYLTKVARRHRLTITKQTLQNVIARYHEDYNTWPGNWTPKQLNGETWEWNAQKKEFEDKGLPPLVRNNPNVFDNLLENNNQRRIKYLDETTLFCWDPNERDLTKVSDYFRMNGGEKLPGPLAFRHPDSGKVQAYKVTIYPVDKKVVVEVKEDKDCEL